MGLWRPLPTVFDLGKTLKVRIDQGFPSKPPFELEYVIRPEHQPRKRGGGDSRGIAPGPSYAIRSALAQAIVLVSPSTVHIKFSCTATRCLAHQGLHRWVFHQPAVGWNRQQPALRRRSVPRPRGWQHDSARRCSTSQGRLFLHPARTAT